MISEVKIRDFHGKDRPMSEQYGLIAMKFADADAAATLLEELKTTTLEEMKTKLILEQGAMPESKAERLVKSSPEWRQYIEQMRKARADAKG